jgi:hypothetical protein
VVVGHWLDTRLVGQGGMPPRWAPQVRSQSFAVMQDDRFVVASYGTDPYERGAVEVWCVPPPIGESAAPGLLAAPPGNMDLENTAWADAHGRYTETPELNISLVRPVTPLIDGSMPPGQGPELWVVVARPADAPELVRSWLQRGARVRLMLPYPPQPGETVPEGMGWGVSSVSWYPNQQVDLVVADTLLWRGPLERLPPALLSAGAPAGGQVSDEALAAWRARPPLQSRSSVRYDEKSIEVALREGHLDVARQLAEAMGTMSHSTDRYVSYARAIGQKRPDDVQWLDAPPPGPMILTFDPYHPWPVVETLPPDVPVAVLVASPQETTQIPRALFTGIWPNRDRQLRLMTNTWMVVDAEGTILWAGGSEGVRDALRLLDP